MSCINAPPVRPAPAARRLAALLTALVAGAAMVAGCEGEHLFVDGVDEKLPPRVDILEPIGGETVAPGDSILVRANIRDNAGATRVRMLGVALREDPELGIEQPVTRLEERVIDFPQPAPDTSIARFLRATDEVLLEEVHLIVTALDLAGNIGADTVMVWVGVTSGFD